MATSDSSAEKKIRKSIILFSLTVVILLVVVIFIRTITVVQRSIELPACTPEDTDFIQGDSGLISRFQEALRFRTISEDVHKYDTDELWKIQQFIKQTYRTLHSSPLVRVETIANYSLLYTISGTNSSLKPFMLTGHLDVVPVFRDRWDVPPFDASIVDDFIYGRGTIDDKHTVFGILEALEFLLKRGHKPRRPFYLAFGHDEEVGGVDGAAAIGQVLKDRGVQLEFILDEGLTVLQGVIPGIKKPVALIGTSEKGSLTVELTVTAQGGHSSMPKKESSIGILANALARLEANSHPNMFGYGPEKGMFEHLASEMSVPFRMIMSNLWLFSPLVSRFLSGKPETNAVVRTTTAVTIFNAGVKFNVIAPVAKAVVNHRIHPAQSVQEVFDYDRITIGDDRVQMKILYSMEPLPLSSYADDCFGFQMIKTSVRQVWGYKQVVVAPGVMIGNTDTRHYTDLTSDIYRFSPTFMFPSDLARFHGDNERISRKNYEEAVNFFYHVMVNADKATLEPLHAHGSEL